METTNEKGRESDQPDPDTRKQLNFKRSNHMSLNRTTIIGYLGQDPQLRFTPQGSPVCTLSVATDESYTDKSTWRTQGSRRMAPGHRLGQAGHQLQRDAH